MGRPAAGPTRRWPVSLAPGRSTEAAGARTDPPFDRGSVYGSRSYQEALAARGAVPSMSRRGDCWGNAVVESFFATFKRVWCIGAPGIHIAS